MSAQDEAIIKGEEKEAIKYLNKFPLIALFIFVSTIAISQLWFGTMRSFAEVYIFKSNQLSPMQWLMMSVVMTVVVLFTSQKVFKLPITSIFTLWRKFLIPSNFPSFPTLPTRKVFRSCPAFRHFRLSPPPLGKFSQPPPQTVSFIETMKFSVSSEKKLWIISQLAQTYTLWAPIIGKISQVNGKMYQRIFILILLPAKTDKVTNLKLGNLFANKIFTLMPLDQSFQLLPNSVSVGALGFVVVTERLLASENKCCKAVAGKCWASGNYFLRVKVCWEISPNTWWQTHAWSQSSSRLWLFILFPFSPRSIFYLGRATNISHGEDLEN